MASDAFLLGHDHNSKETEHLFSMTRRLAFKEFVYFFLEIFKNNGLRDYAIYFKFKDRKIIFLF